MKSNTNLKTLIDKVASLITIATAFLVPIFFLPTTTEFFAFNKLALITGITVLLLIVWGLKIIIGDKIEFAKSPIDRGILLIIIVGILGSIFSISKGDSLYGSPGRWLGIVSFLIMTAYFYVSSPFLKGQKTIKTAIFALLIGSTVSTVIALLGYYNIYLGQADFLRATNFTLTGSINDAILVSALSVVLSIAFIIHESNQSTKISLMGLFFINFLYVALTGSLLGWAVVLMGLVLTVLFSSKTKIMESKMELISAGFSAIVMATAVFVPTTRNVIVNPNYRSDLVLPLRESWIVATSTIQDHPILATGPGTFYVNFARYRPLSLNTSPYWNVQFNLPFNGLFEILTTLGIVGLGIAIYFSWKIISFSLETNKLNDETGLGTIVSVLTLTVLGSFLFTFPTILNIYLILFGLSLLVATNITLAGQFKNVKVLSIGITEVMSLGTDESTSISREYIKYVLSIPIFLFAGYISYLGYKTYAGEYYMRKSIVATINNAGGEAYNFQTKAIENNPKRDYYQTAYARTNLALANTLASKEDLTDAERQTIQTLLSQAIRNSRVASETLNPLNARNWETRAIIYRAMLNVAQNAPDWAVNSYNTAIQLDPTNPRLRVDLGGIYYALGDFLSAANQFRQATVLKQDYANAHYNFGMALINLEDYDSAKRELEITKLLVPEGTPDYEAVVNQIASLESLADVAGATTEDKPTIEELAGVEEEIVEAEQEPLENVGEGIPPEDLSTEVLPTQEEMEETAETPEEESEEETSEEESQE